MVRALVLDASALLAFFKTTERGHQRVKDLIKDPDIRKEAHALNMMELYRVISSRLGVSRAEACVQMIHSLGIRVADDMDEAFWKDMAWLKVQFKDDVSVGDCAALALARKRNVPLLGSDAAAFQGMAKANIIQLKTFR